MARIPTLFVVSKEDIDEVWDVQLEQIDNFYANKEQVHFKPIKYGSDNSRKKDSYRIDGDAKVDWQNDGGCSPDALRTSKFKIMDSDF